MWMIEEDNSEQYEDVDMIRDMLEDYYGTAMQRFPMAVIDLAGIGSMSDEEVIQKARENGLIYTNAYEKNWNT